MDRVTQAFLSFHSFDMNSLSPKFSFYIFSTFKKAGTSNSIVIKSWSKMESFNFPDLQHILLQVFFSFSGFQKLERDVAEYITNFPHHTTKSRSQTCHKVRNNQKTYQFEGFRKIFGCFTNLELATQRVLPIFGWWRFLHILASLSNFWKSEKSKNNYISLKASE